MEYKTGSDIQGEQLEQLDKIMKSWDIEECSFDSLFLSNPFNSPSLNIETFDELMNRDEKRKEDGLPGKIKIKKLIKDEKGTVIVIPFAYEEKLVHDQFTPEQESSGGESGGEGEGEEGEKTGEKPVEDEDDGEEGEGEGAGQGSAGEHGISKESYELGKELSEKLDLPNLENKGKKVPIPEPFYDLTDKTRGYGQFLNKKDTVDQIIRTNILLGTVDPDDIDPTKLIVSPDDKIYNALSEEKQYQSQAVVFFIRDYSGSMQGEPTEIACNLHTMIYTWLCFQYENRVISRFILHDTEAKEATDFNEYYRSQVAGGTYISSAYRLVKSIIEGENLDRDYNIYVFQCSDGDDWHESTHEAPGLIKSVMKYCNRIGITVIKSGWRAKKSTSFEEYMKNSNILSQYDIIRMASITNGKNETLEKAIKYMVSED